MTEIDLISLGAGVQSSTMAKMAALGLIKPMPKGAIFADTKWEPQAVYDWLNWLEKDLPFPVWRVSKGDLARSALTIRDKRDGSGKWAKTCVPAWMKNADGSRGTVQRQCTYDYKVVPIMQEALRALRREGAKSVVQWIGISLDEAHRMKPSRDPRITHRYPLIEMRMKRHDCLRWMEANGFPTPPRSACVFCPYHSDHEWRRLRDEEPAEFNRAVEFERAYQQVKAQTNNMRAVPYLHDSLVPLDQVDFSTDVEQGQQLLWGNECEGMCGV